MNQHVATVKNLEKLSAGPSDAATCRMPSWLARSAAVADALQANVKARKDVSFLKGQLLACVFMEPSTRTSCSFMAAIQRLGGTSILVNEQGSSAKKGETLEDTMRCLESYADALVLRHPVKGSAERAAAACQKPILVRKPACLLLPE